ncbi:hypothetical protein BYT27DRAFT_7183770 [Phlegmacium glaucopus]|nr:hypothetical protein BYT27DRAFT_7183770 [Phlegmacium glaucopus]
MDIASLRKAIITGIQDIESTRYGQLSSSSIVLFDHLMTFDDEVSLIWNSSWSLGKILFLVNRYYTLASAIFNGYALFSSTLTDQFCHRMFQWEGWTGLVACMIGEAILQIRIYALYSLNKKVLALMLISFILCSAASGWILGTQLASISVTALATPRGRFCVPIDIPHRFFTFWIPTLACESFLCSLALFQGLRTFRLDGSMFSSGRKLMRILIRDSILYFLVICATYLTCLLVWALARNTLRGVPVGFSVAMSCVLANRAVLNARKMGKSISRSRIIEDSAERYDTIKSFGVSGTLNVLELDQLRTMRSEKHFDEA